MKPSWRDAPEWAQWLAQDRSGEWLWYENMPYIYNDKINIWSTLGEYRMCRKVNHNWKDTLEQRPEQ